MVCLKILTIYSLTTISFLNEKVDVILRIIDFNSNKAESHAGSFKRRIGTVAVSDPEGVGREYTVSKIPSALGA